MGYMHQRHTFISDPDKDISEYANVNANDGSDSQSESANNQVICDVCKCTYEEADT